MEISIFDMDNNEWETNKVIFQNNMVFFDTEGYMMRMPLHYVKYIKIKKIKK